MFLTSTRVGLVDEALKPRIHVALSIPTMDQATAKRSWKQSLHSAMALRASRGSTIKMDVEGIISWAMGRYRKRSVADRTWSYLQIYNAIETAMAMAVYGYGDESISDSEAESEGQTSNDGEIKRSTDTIILTARHFSIGERFTQGFNSYRKFTAIDTAISDWYYY